MLMRMLFLLKDWLRQVMKRDPSVNMPEATPLSAYGSAEIEENWMYVRMSRLSSWIIRRVSLSRVVHKRRENYLRMLAAFADNDCYRPLYPALLKNVVPYVFPLYVKDGDAVYHRLRKMKIPVFRWDDIPERVCETSTEYQSRLIQLPIHQELSSTELDRIISSVNDALSKSRQPTHTVPDESRV